MHILIVPSWYPSNENPVNGIFFLEQAQALQRAGHRVHVLVTPKFKSVKELIKASSWENLGTHITSDLYKGIKTYRIAPWQCFPMCFTKSASRLLILYGMRLFKQYLAEEGAPDIIHAHSALYGGYLAVNIGQEWGRPVFVTEHLSSIMKGRLSRSRSEIVQFTVQHSRVNLTVSPILAEALLKYFPRNKPIVVGNFVDTSFFDLLTELLPREPFIFCNIGFLNENKGVDTLIQSFTKISKNRHVQLKIAGDGKIRKRLEKMALDLGIKDKVEFLGLLDRKQVRDLIQQSHALVSASHIETFGITLIEAMSCGKPVIATRSGGPEMFVNEKNGILVPTGDVDALALGMEEMVSGYGRYDPYSIRSDCMASFSEELFVKRLETLYRGSV